MKKLILICCLTITFGYSQKNYDFDYVLEYNSTLHLNSTKEAKRYYFINSKNNNYFAIITEKDSLNYNFVFEDFNAKIHTKAIFLKSALNDAELININCKNIFRIKSSVKSENFDLLQLKDSLIDNKTFKHFQFRSTNLNEKKRKKIGTDHYLIDTSSIFQLPIFTSIPIFDTWLSSKPSAKGLIKERTYFNENGKLQYTETFISYNKTEKKVFVPKKCGETLYIFE